MLPSKMSLIKKPFTHPNICHFISSNASRSKLYWKGTMPFSYVKMTSYSSPMFTNVEMTENLYFPFENCQCFTVFKQRSSLGHLDNIHKFLSYILYESFEISMPLSLFDEKIDSERHPMILYVCLSSETKSAFYSKLFKVLHLLTCSLWNSHE